MPRGLQAKASAPQEPIRERGQRGDDGHSQRDHALPFEGDAPEIHDAPPVVTVALSILSEVGEQDRGGRPKSAQGIDYHQRRRFIQARAGEAVRMVSAHEKTYTSPKCIVSKNA